MMAYSDDRRPKIAIIGTGTLGLAISGELARCGCEVYVHDKNEDSLQQVHHHLEEHRAQLVGENLPAGDKTFSVIAENHLSQAVMEADFVIEAVVEDLSIKNALMKNLSLMCPEDTVICSNTLTLNLENLFSGIKNPQRTLGMRFLLPVYYIPLVEVTAHSSTSSATIDKVKELLRFIKKESFSRGGDEPPRKLMMHEARTMQLMTAGRSLSVDTGRSHDRGSHDTRSSHGDF